MDALYKPIDNNFGHEIEKLAAKRKYVGILYFTSLHELISTTAIVKKLYTAAGAPFMELTTGEEIRLDQVVKIGHATNPAYDFEDYTCDC